MKLSREKLKQVAKLGSISIVVLITITCLYVRTASIQQNDTPQSDLLFPPVSTPPTKSAYETYVSRFVNENSIQFGDKNSPQVFIVATNVGCTYCHMINGNSLEVNKLHGQPFLTKELGGNYIPPLPEIKKLVDKGKAFLLWIYYNHGSDNGEIAVQALYCANEKGKFWEAHNLLMSDSGFNFVKDTLKQDLSKTTEVAEFLSAIISPSEMRACLDSGKYSAQLTRDLNIASELQISGAPDFFLNGQEYLGAVSWTSFK